MIATISQRINSPTNIPDILSSLEPKRRYRAPMALN
ncbi:hypothetical protein NK6_7463 [Bradyrhizobium diazoefficiens]|uniref:Uncharacterized protein n=1 Tax=Bradyrhizobium diazoefficiens TaxID=1355477 RepID=A0A0E4BTT4_9BRAD|nr:hypothetical protein NK6_7463 [Bradyrhizobium diazoefficiens]